MSTSKRWKLDKEDGLKIARVLVYSAGSALIAALVTILADLDLPSWVLPLVPVINTGLYALEKWLRDEKDKILS